MERNDCKKHINWYGQLKFTYLLEKQISSEQTSLSDNTLDLQKLFDNQQNNTSPNSYIFNPVSPLFNFYLTHCESNLSSSKDVASLALASYNQSSPGLSLVSQSSSLNNSNVKSSNALGPEYVLDCSGNMYQANSFQAEHLMGNKITCFYYTDFNPSFKYQQRITVQSELERINFLGSEWL